MLLRTCVCIQASLAHGIVHILQRARNATAPRFEKMSRMSHWRIFTVFPLTRRHAVGYDVDKIEGGCRDQQGCADGDRRCASSVLIPERGNGPGRPGVRAAGPDQRLSRG